MDLRSASASSEFPYGSELIPFILFKAGKVSYAKSRRDKLAMMSERGGKIISVWPGKWSSDAFEIDDRALARRVLQQSKHTSLADLEYAEHHEGKHHTQASSECKMCQEHLNGDHAKPPYGATYCENSKCPTGESEPSQTRVF